MSHSLLMELSDEQQELVSGGGQVTDIKDLIKTKLDAKKSDTDLNFLVESTFKGSSVAQAFNNKFDKFSTDAYKDFYATFD